MRHRPLIALLALAGCNRPPQPAVETAAAAGGAGDTTVADTTAEGTLRVVGPQETAQIVLRGATASVGLTGPLADELRRLSGATVRVTGGPQNNLSPLPPRAVLVRDYQILEVDGRRPVVGILLSRDDRVWLAGQDTVELVGVTADLARRLGAKLFVVGVREGSQLRVKSFGVIRDPR